MHRALVLILSVAVLASSTSLRGSTQSQSAPDTFDESEYGESEMEGNFSDFSLHQFLSDDNGREGTASSNDDKREKALAKSAALAADEEDDSEDTADDSDSFVQTAKKSFDASATNANRMKQDPDALHDETQFVDKDPAMGPADSFDSLPRQLLAKGAEHDRVLVGEEISNNGVVGDDKSSNEEDSHSLLQNKKDTLRAREIAAILLKQDPKAEEEPQIFNTESAAAMDDSADSSLHQLLVSEDTGDSGSVAREGGADDGEDINPSAQAAEEQSDKEDLDASDEYESGDADMAVNQGDSSDFSVHHFPTDNDGREGTSTSDDDSGDAEIAKTKTLAADHHFDTEDTPDDVDS